MTTFKPTLFLVSNICDTGDCDHFLDCDLTQLTLKNDNGDGDGETFFVVR